MKKAINKASMITMVFITVFIMGFKKAAFSNDVRPNPIELKAIDNVDKQPVFELKVNNTDDEAYVIRVKDGYGDLLYSETLKGKDLSRKYRIDVNLDELNDLFNLRFEVTKVKTRETFIYNVSRKNRVVPEMIIARL